MVKCYICEKGNLVKKKVPYKIHGVLVGIYEAETCPKCGEVFYSEKVFDEMTTKTKELGLWGLEAKTKIGQAGSTLDIRLTKKIIEFLGLKKGKEVTICPEDKHTLVVKVA